MNTMRVFERDDVEYNTQYVLKADADAEIAAAKARERERCAKLCEAQADEPLALRSNNLLGHAAQARWYCLSREGMATLCVDEDDANQVAAESWVSHPSNGPYRVAQMVDMPPPLTARELELIQGLIDREMYHAKLCDGIANRTMADKQKGWDMERVALLRKLGGIGT